MTQISTLSETDESQATSPEPPSTSAPKQSGLVAELRTAVAADLHAESLGELGFDDRRELARELTLSRLRRRDADMVSAGGSRSTP